MTRNRIVQVDGSNNAKCLSKDYIQDSPYNCYKAADFTAELAYLTTNLANLAFLYTFHNGVSVTGVNVTSIAPSFGVSAPNLDAISGSPTLTGTGILASAGSDTIDSTLTSPLFDPTKTVCIAVIGYIATRGGGGRIGNLATGNTINCNAGLANTQVVSNATVNCGVAGSNIISQIVVGWHDGGVTLTGQCLNHTAVTGVITALTAGDGKARVLGGSTGLSRFQAILGLSVAPSAGDLVKLASWATTYYGTILAT